ncbi:hypothetical protein BCR33DRAFT_785099 [Rhizoclosmatium globosum]|uniref:Integrase core domain-containing protein n=1 Tax=Rhizoclosmatium globosum TaxID=329046 RepID=A0A1Y2CC49_9FUNG|nr:hypothetical protein BCR33DRAFT_785099 [Rhizoclosmatium globosum]|eukprot:ORY44424.1 hypothetical protein BCR33DRAFT_785099 [Rhizoclosmatium globosum]
MPPPCYCTVTGRRLFDCEHCKDVSSHSEAILSLFCAAHGLLTICCLECVQPQLPPPISSQPQLPPPISSISLPVYCKVTGRNKRDCRHCLSTTLDRTNDPHWFCTSTGVLENECNHCEIAESNHGDEAGNSSDGTDVDSDDEATSTVLREIPTNNHYSALDPNDVAGLYAVIVNLLEEPGTGKTKKLTGPQVVKALEERHGFKRSLRWLNLYKAEHKLSTVRVGPSLMEQSHEWIEDIKERVYGGYNATKLQYHLSVKWGVTVGRTKLWQILKAHNIALSDTWIPTPLIEQLVATETTDKPGIGYRGITDAIRNRYHIKVAQSKQVNSEMSCFGVFMVPEELILFGTLMDTINCPGLGLEFTAVRMGSLEDMCGDYGSENVIVATIQGYYSRMSGFGHDRHIYGTSKRNTRIEGGWRILSKDHMKRWKTLFEAMELDGDYRFNTLDFYHIKVAQYVFGEFIKQDLEEWCLRWNSHRIRKSKHSEGNYSDVGHPVPGNLREVALEAAADKIPFIGYDMLDESDPFDLAPFQAGFSEAAVAACCFPITKGNMCRLFQILTRDDDLRVKLGFDFV